MILNSDSTEGSQASFFSYAVNPDADRLTWTGKGHRLVLIGAQQTHEFRRLSVVQGKQAVVVLRPKTNARSVNAE